MTAADDAAILAVLNAVPGLLVFDGYVTDSDESAKTVGVDKPYVVFHRLDDDESIGDSLSAGTGGARLQEFQVTYVAKTAAIARQIGDVQRAALNRRFIAMPAGQRFVRRSDDNLGVQRDDVWSRPDGGPLFYGADRYTVGA